jgi:small subunit ribosomal protein S1
MDEAWWASVLQEEQRGKPTSRAKTGSLSEKNSLAAADWQRARALFEKDEVICMAVVGCNRGGLLVEAEGMRGFVPASHLVSLPVQVSEEERQELMRKRLGDTLSLKIIEFDPERGRIVFSERAAKAGPGCRAQLLASLRPGERHFGEVTNITNFGVFVDLGGMEGLVHVSEISWGRVLRAEDHVHCGQKVEVEILSVDREQGRVALSLKRIQPDPWATVGQRFEVGQRVPCRVTRITSFGAFATLEEGVEGLIHVSELGRGSVEDPRSVVREGDRLVARILSLDCGSRKMALSLREAEDGSTDQMTDLE